jgi:hypothetical protein
LEPSAQSKMGRLLMHRPDRLAAAWRRLCKDVADGDATPSLLLDGLVEPFLIELGATLLGRSGSAWARTQGVLRVSAERGVPALYEEFGLLRRCVTDAVSALGGTLDERIRLSQGINEAVDSAVILARRLADPSFPAPATPFGGVVVELFERPARASLAPSTSPAVGLH